MKHLRNLVIAMLTLALLMPMVAMAEELPYMQALTQSAYINTLPLTTESYPEVCIAPNYFSSMFISQYNAPYFIHFPCPGNTYVVSFDEYSVSFIDFEQLRQYSYIAQSSYAYETFLDKCDVEEYILADGSNGVAMYINPDSRYARALIGVSGIAKSTKLEIRITDDSLRNKGAVEIIARLTEEIQNEVARVQASMTVELAERYWTDGTYAGFVVSNTARNSEPVVLTYTLPAGYMIESMDDSDVTIVTVRGQRDALEVDFDMETYSYVNSKLEDEPEAVTTATIDGIEYRIYSHWYNDKILSAYVDRVISTTAGYSGEDTMYLTIHLDPEGDFEWTSIEALEADLATVVSGIQIVTGKSLPDYQSAAPYAANEPVVTEAHAGDDGWTCPTCGETVTSNFCPNDGTAKPEDASWVCPSCGETVTTNFCPNDGTAKDAA